MADRTQLEVAPAHPGLADWPDVAEGLLEDIDRLRRFATDLLLLARLDSGEHLEADPVDLGGFVRSVLVRRPTGRVPVTVTVLSGIATGPAAAAPSRAAGRREVGAAPYGLMEVCNDGPPIPESDVRRPDMRGSERAVMTRGQRAPVPRVPSALMAAARPRSAARVPCR